MKKNKAAAISLARLSAAVPCSFPQLSPATQPLLRSEARAAKQRLLPSYAALAALLFPLGATQPESKGCVAGTAGKEWQLRRAGKKLETSTSKLNKNN